MKREELQNDICYVGFWDDYRVIFKMRNGIEDCFGFITSDNRFFKNQGCCTGGGITFRLATMMEMTWLNNCIVEGKITPQPKPITEPQYEIY